MTNTKATWVQDGNLWRMYIGDYLILRVCVNMHYEKGQAPRLSYSGHVGWCSGGKGFTEIEKRNLDTFHEASEWCRTTAIDMVDSLSRQLNCSNFATPFEE